MEAKKDTMWQRINEAMVDSAVAAVREKYTPGPWELTPYGNDRLEVQGGPGKLIAVVWPMDNYTTQANNTNARLIAAAPDLLAALKHCAAVLAAGPTFPDTDRIGALKETLAAIARAKED